MAGGKRQPREDALHSACQHTFALPLMHWLDSGYPHEARVRWCEGKKRQTLHSLDLSCD